MNRDEVIALLKDLLFEKDLLHNNFTGRVDISKSLRASLAISAAIDAISRPVRIEIWRDGGRHVNADKLIEVQVHEMTCQDLYLVEKKERDTALPAERERPHKLGLFKR